MKFATLLVILMTAVSVFAKDKEKTVSQKPVQWEVGYSRTGIKSVHYDNLHEAFADGYHVSGAENYTCVGGDEHNAPSCLTGFDWYATMYSGEAIAFSDGTAYACEPGSCPDWFMRVEMSTKSDTCTKAKDDSRMCPFYYRVTDKDEIELKDKFGLGSTFPAPILDGKRHDLR